MKVIAIKRGFIHGELKNIGDNFECTSDEFSNVWMSEDIKDIPSQKDNSKVKKIEDVEFEPLEIPSLMNKERKPKKNKKVS